MTDQTLSQLIHGSSKVGKSTYTFTGPLPMLSLDAEGSTKFINSAGFRSENKLRRISWNPIKERPPRHDGTWEVCVVNVPDWQTMRSAYDHLRMSPHDFRHVSLDSITEIQRKCKKNIKSTGQFQQQEWGQLLDEMDTLIRGFRDLLLLDNPLQVATFIAESDNKKTGKWSPYLQGAVATSLPYWVDLCGYAYQEKDPATGQQIFKILAAPHPQFEAGERVQGRLDATLINPTINDILTKIYS